MVPLARQGGIFRGWLVKCIVTCVMQCMLMISWLKVEPTPDLENPSYRQITYAELYAKVADAVSSLTEQGVKMGDRVASYSSNCIVSSYCKALGTSHISDGGIIRKRLLFVSPLQQLALYGLALQQISVRTAYSKGKASLFD